MTWYDSKETSFWQSYPDTKLEDAVTLRAVQLEEEEYKMSLEQAIQSLIKRGDECMYKAKRKGKKPGDI
jgi:hypothetical protein